MAAVGHVPHINSFERNADVTLVTSGYKKLCRFCLNAASKKIDEKTYELFKSLTNVDLVYGHPSGICFACESQLQSACEFRFSLLEVERNWKTYFHSKYVEFLKSLEEESIYDEIEMVNGTKGDNRDEPFDPSTNTLPIISYQQQNISPNVSLPVVFDSFYRHYNENALPLKMTRQTVQKFNQSQPDPKEYVSISESTAIADYMSSAEVRANQFIFESLPRVSYVSVEAEESYVTSGFMDNDSDNFPNCFSKESINSTRNNQYHKRYNLVKSKQTRIKCVFIGDAGVGKTNLILSYLKNKFVDEHAPTAYDIYNFDVKVNDAPVHVTLCDTAGQNSFDQLRQLSYPDCDVFVLCFSVVKPESFLAIKHKWAPKFCKTEASLLLVGTQADLKTDKQVMDNLKKRGLRPVSVIDSLELASSIGAEFIETSSRNNLGVKDAFDTAIWDALRALKMKKSKKSRFWKKLMCWS